MLNEERGKRDEFEDEKVRGWEARKRGCIKLKESATDNCQQTTHNMQQTTNNKLTYTDSRFAVI